MKLSLVELAQKKKLPKYQYMDEITLNWIIKNQPKFSIQNKYYINPSILKRYKNFIPSKNWFVEKREIKSIHGMRHLLRTEIFSTLLGDLYNFNRRKIQNLKLAAVLHDIRRRNDKKDLFHGQRSAKWFFRNFSRIKKFFRLSLLDIDIEEVYYAIYFHEKPYNKIYSTTNYKKHKIAVDLLKTADALDRYRQPKIKWWIDDSYLKLVPNEKLKAFAYNLVVNSEKKYLESGDEIKCIFESLKLLTYEHN
ncbi:MAG: hypothetical protein DDT19_02241 [Syntrophomonadaceae bacterium]|nr:hypothetical protein [Bacillota bacterium]